MCLRLCEAAQSLCAQGKDRNLSVPSCSPLERQGAGPVDFGGRKPRPLAPGGLLKHRPTCTSPSPGHQAAPVWSGAPQVGTGWWGADSRLLRTAPSCHPGSSQKDPSPPPPAHTHTHVQQGTHMLISGSPWCKRLGAGGLSAQNLGCCQNPSESCLLPSSRPPPPPAAPISGWAAEVTAAGADTPPTHSHRAASFSTTSAKGWGWGTNPPASLLPPPPPNGAQLPLPPSMWGRRGPMFGWGPFL